jgi:hypothetical protein
MATKRRLTDMYRVEKSITFDDGQGDPITVVVRKMNPVDHQSALRYANAARSRAAALKNHPEDDEYQAQWALVLDYDRESLTRYLLEDFRINRSPILEAELADDEEWKKDGYLDGLQHDWMDHLKDVYAADPEDVDAKRVFTELQRFTDKLDEIVQAAVDNLEDDLEKKSEQDLRQQVFDKLFSSYASIAWLNEYRRCEVAYSVRTEDGKERYFKHRDEVSELPTEIFQQLQEAYRELTVEVQEGKDSLVTEGSSPLSEPPASQETDSDSGQGDATE